MSKYGDDKLVSEEIHDIFNEYPQVLYGFSNIDFSKYSEEYKCALVFAVPYSEMMTLKTNNEEKFQAGIDAARGKIDEIISKLENMFCKNKIKYCVPPVAQSSENELIAPFSFKYAAVNAGLGWIGKNDVLITESYGPRQRLSAVLLDYDLPKGIPIIESRCSQQCNKCINVCPHKALTGFTWNINAKRREIIDYKLCNEKRSMFIEKLGRKSSCGLCMVVCPFGIN